MTAPARLPDWRPRLVAYLGAVRTRPFAYGQHDCALFAAGAVTAMTAVDLSDGYRDRYKSLKAGLKLAGISPVDLVRRAFDEVPPALAQVGDIAVIGQVGVPALGIFDGETILVLREDGLGRMPRAAATLAFRVA